MTQRKKERKKERRGVERQIQTLIFLSPPAIKVVAKCADLGERTFLHLGKGPLDKLQIKWSAILQMNN
jgi:hypothetical protein